MRDSACATRPFSLCGSGLVLRFSVSPLHVHGITQNVYIVIYLSYVCTSSCWSLLYLSDLSLASSPGPSPLILAVRWYGYCCGYQLNGQLNFILSCRSPLMQLVPLQSQVLNAQTFCIEYACCLHFTVVKVCKFLSWHRYDISPSYRIIVKTRTTKRETTERGYWLLLCVPNGLAVIQRVDVGGGKVCTQTAQDTTDSMVGRRLL